MHIRPTSSLAGEAVLPGDKSISHRYAILGGMAEGITRIHNYSPSDDCHATLSCLQQLGINIHHTSDSIEIKSGGWTKLRPPTRTLDAGNSGTTMRLLSALLAASRFTATIQGDASLNRRPMGRIIKPLQQMGARLEASQGEFPPLSIQGAPLDGIDFRMPVASAQVKSCVLLAGLMAQGTTTVVEEVLTRDHTERALPLFGADVSREGQQISVKGPAVLRAAEMSVPGDFSSAIFFMVASLLTPGADIRIRRVGVNPTRTALLDLLVGAGARIRKSDRLESSNEPVCDLRIQHSPMLLKRFPNKISGKLLANMIDEIPVLAVLGVYLNGGLQVRGADELRKKESDRIHAIVSNLRSLGVETEEFRDGFRIPSGQKLQGGKVTTFGDHRIAMAFAVAGLVSEQPVELDDLACVAVSHPDFFRVLETLRGGSTT